MLERRGVYKILVESPDGKHLESLRVDGKIILKRVFKKQDAKE
jgi:hypothetical protein